LKLNVLLYLPGESIVALQSSSKGLYKLISDYEDFIWRWICLRSKILLTKKNSFKVQFQLEYIERKLDNRILHLTYKLLEAQHLQFHFKIHIYRPPTLAKYRNYHYISETEFFYDLIHLRQKMNLIEQQYSNIDVMKRAQKLLIALKHSAKPYSPSYAIWLHNFLVIDRFRVLEIFPAM